MHHDPERSTGCLGHQGEPDCTTKELNLSASTGKWTGHRTLQVLFIRYMAGNKATDQSCGDFRDSS